MVLIECARVGVVQRACCRVLRAAMSSCAVCAAVCAAMRVQACRQTQQTSSFLPCFLCFAVH